MSASVWTNVSSEVPEVDPKVLEKSLSSVAISLLSDDVPDVDPVLEVPEVPDESDDVSLDAVSLDVELSELADALLAPIAWARAFSAPPRSP